MKVCIIGWYGTETIGDRAILAGILALLTETFDDLQVSLGSLYPFFSERTVEEDQDLWKLLAGRAVDVEVFDSTKKSALSQAIRGSELLVLGGGPIMDLREIHMLAYAFRYARKRRVKTFVFGCGIGPLSMKSCRKAAFDILSNADVSIFRDSLAEKEAHDLCGATRLNTQSAVDPAAYCALRYKNSVTLPVPTQTISVNLRKIFAEYGSGDLSERFERFSEKLVQKICDDNPENRVELVPNHYFFVGRDDRSFLNQLKFRLGQRELRVQNRPLSLRETMDRYGSSASCVGMRFHAAVLMALLNGRCRIVNYTGSEKGKISGFLTDFDHQHYFGSERMVSLDTAAWSLSAFDDLVSDTVFVPNMERLQIAFDTYRNALAACLN
jgi:polysaccharide pyruvyl transferase WcaK-like protein